jgi:hypothetical protein
MGTTATATREYKLGPKALGFVHDFTSTVAGLVGPYGSGKTTLIPLKIQIGAAQTVPDSDSVLRYRVLILRGTFSMIESALLPVMQQHMPPGTVFTKGSPITAKYKTQGMEIHCDLVALDREEDVKRIQGGSYDAMYCDESRDTDWGIVQVAMTRVRAVTDDGKAKPLSIGIVSNPSDETHWLFKNFVGNPLPGWTLYHQPSGMSPEREGPYDESYYRRMIESNRDDQTFIDVHVHGKFGLWAPAGDSVVSSFKSGRHFAELNVSPNLPLIIGLDVGVSWNALTYMQRMNGQLRVIGEQIIENKAAMAAAPAAREFVRDHLYGAPVAMCTVDPSAEQRSAVSGELVVDIWRAATRWTINTAPSPRVSERVTALNAIFASNNADGEAAILVDSRKCPVLAQALMGQYRWKLRKAAIGADKTSVDGEIDKNNRPWADAGDSLGYAVMGAGAYGALIDFSRTRPGMLKGPMCTRCRQTIREGRCGCPASASAFGW